MQLSGLHCGRRRGASCGWAVASRLIVPNPKHGRASAPVWQAGALLNQVSDLPGTGEVNPRPANSSDGRPLHVMGESALTIRRREGSDLTTNLDLPL
jgi:hypothetical protein